MLHVLSATEHVVNDAEADTSRNEQHKGCESFEHGYS